MGPLKHFSATLGKIMESLDSYHDEQIICINPLAVLTPSSEAVVCSISDSEALLLNDGAYGMRYLLEIGIAKEVLTVWQAWRNGKVPSLDEKVEAVVYYAEHDAYQPVAEGS